MEKLLSHRLSFYGLSLVKRSDRLYFLVDMYSGECFEDMSIYYIMSLLEMWTRNRKRV